MATTKYSHAFLVGSFNGNVSPEMLENDRFKYWRRETVKRKPTDDERKYPSDSGYDGLCGMYYKAHLDAMIEVEDRKKNIIQDSEKDLENICHFVCDYTQACKLVTLHLSKQDDNDHEKYNPFDYSFKIEKLHLYFFPLGVVLFAIEIDDTGTELDDLTSAHYSLTQMNLDKLKSKDLNKWLNPLLVYCNNGRLYKDGNKLKIFQIIEPNIDQFELQSNYLKNALLYELGTSSPIGCIRGIRRKEMGPSDSYYCLIIKENTVSSFNNWTGLALLDSFTVLGTEIRRDDWNFVYFPLIYLRCIFEKTFCFTRNYLYRNQHNSQNINLSEQIRFMEKYYFYDNISYSFQPNLLYSAMTKGLQIKEEREELARQIKENAKEEEEKRKALEEKRQSRTLALVSVFAVFSVGWDLFQLVDYTFGLKNKYMPARNLMIPGGIALIICVILVFWILGLIYKWPVSLLILRKCKEGIMCARRKSEEWYDLIKRKCSKPVVEETKHIKMNEEARSHIIQQHFEKVGIGSKFFVETPEELVNEIEIRFQDQLSAARLDADNRFRIELTFPRNIGTENTIHVSKLTEEQKENIEIKDRDGKKSRVVYVDKEVYTSQCCLILSSDWNLITMFPGELAPPLPDSPDIHDDYWDNHVFIEPISK